jgi:uncharacterized membrane protein YphA (DoxX/SURF4 family)
MSKRNKIIYWIATAWLALGLVSTGIVQLMQMEKDVQMMLKLGYPTYLLTLLGIWKLLGAVVILIPKFPLLKEWAYAGIFFTTTGAIFSHLASGAAFTETLPALLLLVLMILSWYFRPVDRKLQVQFF